jgi:hypothetical protein
VIVKKEMLDQPILSIILNLEMIIIEDMINPAFQKIFDADSGCFQHGFFGGPIAKKDWGSSLRLTLVKKFQRSNVDLTPNLTPNFYPGLINYSGRMWFTAVY